VITNPGDLNASVSLTALTPGGTSDLAGLQTVQVPPQTTRSFPLADGLGGQAAGLRLTSNQEVVAGLVGDNGEGDATVDDFTAGVATALPSDGVWPLSVGKSATASVQLVNPGEEDATATVITGTVSGAPTSVDVTVPAGSLKAVDLSRAKSSYVRIQTASTLMRASVVVTRKIGKVDGIAVLDLVADETRTKPVQVVHDPHLG
jgi:P pilus assembly chaperone PapD